MSVWLFLGKVLFFRDVLDGAHSSLFPFFFLFTFLKKFFFFLDIQTFKVILCNLLKCVCTKGRHFGVYKNGRHGWFIRLILFLKYYRVVEEFNQITVEGLR